MSTTEDGAERMPPADGAEVPPERAGVSATGKKPRKPYTQTKARVSWTAKEHARFVKALQLYHRDWKKIEAHVGTKSVIQIRSHAQKYFLKKIKSGEGDQLPPPRPKRTTEATRGTKLLGDALRMNLTTAPDGSIVAVQNGEGVKEFVTPRAPDFGNVYGFLAECFKVNSNSDAPVEEPATKVLGEMARVDRETALLLVENLRKNLQSKELWEQQSELVQDGFITFLAKEDLEKLVKGTTSFTDDKSNPAHCENGDADDTFDDQNPNAPCGSGEGGASGGASNEATDTHKMLQE